MAEDKKKGGVSATMNDFATLLKEFPMAMPAIGEIVKGKVISADSKSVRLDINGLTTGVIRGRELFSESSEFNNIKVGDEMEATVMEAENENGEMELSFRSAGHQRVWDKMGKLLKDGMTLEAKVLQANKGGLMMQVDALSGFMPVSQLNPDHYPRVPGGDKNRILEHLRTLIGMTLQVKVIDINQKEEKLIVSEKAVWEDEQKAVLDAYKIGDTVEGEISALTSFGAFMKFGAGLEGLIHISEIVWQRIDHPKDVLKIGERVRAQIIDLNKSKIYLSMKRLIEDPWKRVKDKYVIGQVVEGEVHKVEPFGLMVKLDNEIHGLAHISELADTQVTDVNQLREMYQTGQSYRFEIVSIEPAEHRLGLKREGVKGKTKKRASKEEGAEAEVETVTEEKSPEVKTEEAPQA